MRQELSALPTDHKLYYNYKGNKQLQALDNKIVERYKDDPPVYPFSPIKPLMISVDENGNQIFLKHSVYMISYQLAKNRELLDVYVDMLKGKMDLLNFKSAQEVGNRVDNQGKISSYYKTPFEKNDL
jgi:hypothetical protein